MKPLPQQPNRWIVAHRGVSGHCPENTRAAFDLAIAQQADAIECDIQLTGDHQVVVCHDTVLSRYGHGNLAINDAPLAELQRLDMGSWFDSRFGNQRMLSLDDLLSEFGAKIPLLIELKADHLTSQQSNVLADKLVELVGQHQLQNQVSFLCFEIDVLQRMKDLAPWAVVVWNTDQPEQLDDVALTQHSWLNAVDGNIQRMSHSVVQRLHQHHKAALTFTCNTPDEVSKAWNMGVDAVITNDPEQTREILRQHGYL